jgi:hypothetical protein
MTFTRNRAILFGAVVVLLVGVVFLYGQSQRPASASVQLTHWEYKNVNCTDDFNSLGNDGWDLVSVSPAAVVNFSGSFSPQGAIGFGSNLMSPCIAYFKRPK